MLTDTTALNPEAAQSIVDPGPENGCGCACACQAVSGIANGISRRSREMNPGTVMVYTPVSGRHGSYYRITAGGCR